MTKIPKLQSAQIAAVLRDLADLIESLPPGLLREAHTDGEYPIRELASLSNEIRSRYEHCGMMVYNMILRGDHDFSFELHAHIPVEINTSRKGPR